MKMPVRNVLAAPATPANAGLTAHHLSHKPHEIARVRQKMTVISVIRQHHVFVVI
jgi:hypothetical protein